MAADRTSHRQYGLGFTQEGSRFGDVHTVNSQVNQVGNIYARTVHIGTSTPTATIGTLDESFDNVPLQQVANFVHRPALRAEIETQLHDKLDEATTRSKVLVVHGLGGTGKTQLVLNYLQEFRNDYSGIFWINAGTKQSVEREFTQIYRLLFLDPTSAEQKLPTIEDVVLRIKNWFKSGARKWLWIFDSADYIENQEDPNFLDIVPLIPASPSVHVIITTRISSAQNMTPLKAVEVRELKPEEALDLLWKSAGLIQGNLAPEELEAAEQIVKELGCLALAINLAGSYILVTPRISSNLSLYLPEYQENRKAILARKPSQMVHQYGESVLTTWETSFKAMERQSTLACYMLTMFAFFDPEDIFLDLFVTALNSKYWNNYQTTCIGNHGTKWEEITSPKANLKIGNIEEAFAILESFSFVRRSHILCTYSMHKLVHAWGFERIDDPKEYEHFGMSSLLFLSLIWSDVKQKQLGRTRVAKHLMAAFIVISKEISRHPKKKNSFPPLFGWLEKLRSFMYDAGYWKEELRIETFILDQKESVLGKEHPETLSAMSDLACTFDNLGQPEIAVQMMREVFEKKRRILGEEHPSTIATMSGLAIALTGQGQSDEAMPLIREAFEKVKRILGEGHPATIATMGSLASILTSQGQLDEAVPLMREVLKKERQNPGEERLLIIATMGGLASILTRQGQLDEAVPLMREVLKERQQILGEEHPHTVTAMSILACALINQQSDEAVPMLKEVLKKRQRILGEEHPDTVNAMSTLACALNYQQSDEAVPMLKEVLEKRRRILGKAHPSITITLERLAAIEDKILRDHKREVNMCKIL